MVSSRTTHVFEVEIIQRPIRVVVRTFRKQPVYRSIWLWHRNSLAMESGTRTGRLCCTVHRGKVRCRWLDCRLSWLQIVDSRNRMRSRRVWKKVRTLGLIARMKSWSCSLARPAAKYSAVSFSAVLCVHWMHCAYGCNLALRTRTRRFHWDDCHQ
jgi:hypothetical protein